MMKNCPFICVFAFQQKRNLGSLTVVLPQGFCARMCASAGTGVSVPAWKGQQYVNKGLCYAGLC